MTPPPNTGLNLELVSCREVYSVQCTVYSVQCTVYSVQCKVYNVQCTVYSVDCTVLYLQLVWEQQFPGFTANVPIVKGMLKGIMQAYCGQVGGGGGQVSGFTLGGGRLLEVR